MVTAGRLERPVIYITLTFCQHGTKSQTQFSLNQCVKLGWDDRLGGYLRDNGLIVRLFC